MMLCCILLALGVQDDPSARARELIRRLGAEQFAVREEATRALRDMGRLALPELRRAAQNSDPEIQERALGLLRRLEVAELLTPRLQKAFAGIEDRLAGGDAHEWTLVLLEATREHEGKRSYPALGAEDVDPLAGLALRGAFSNDEILAVCGVVETWKLLAAAPELIRLLDRDDLVVKKAALWALTELKPPAAAPRVAELLQDPSPAVRANAAMALGRMNGRGDSARIAKLLKDPHPNVRSSAAIALSTLKAQELRSEIAPLLKDDVPAVRQTAAWVCLQLGGRSAVPQVLKLLHDPEGSVRLIALESLQVLDAKELAEDAARLLKDSDPALRCGAAAWLCLHGSDEGIPVLLADSDDLGYLNARRSPDAWTQLSRTSVIVNGGSWRGALEILAVSLNLNLEAPDFRWLGDDATWGNDVKALELLVRPNGQAQFILEPDRLRLVTIEEARGFWRDLYQRK